MWFFFNPWRNCIVFSFVGYQRLAIDSFIFFLTVGGIFFLVPWSPTILWQISQKTKFKTPGPESKPNARPINEINEMFSSRIWWMKPAPMKLLFCIYLSPFSLRITFTRFNPGYIFLSLIFFLVLIVYYNVLFMCCQLNLFCYCYFVN